MARKKTAPKPAAAKPEKKEDEELVVLCFKVLMNPNPPVAGSIRKPCADCGQPVWISPATLAHVAARPHKICCAECVANKQGDDDIELIPPTDAQIAEMCANDPSLTPAMIRRKFPASNPAKSKATFAELIRRTKARKRLDN